MKKSNIDKFLKIILIAFLVVQPVFDLKIFYNSISTLIRTIVIVVLFIMSFFKNNSKGKKAFLIYVVCLSIYFIIHNIHALTFKSVVPGDFNYSTLKEALYFLKMLVPALLIFILYNSGLDDKTIKKIIYCYVITFGITIIATNLLCISYGSYSDQIIKVNIFSWFNNSNGYTYKELSSKGLFEYANQISAVLLMFLPFVINNCIKECKLKNILVLVVNILALFILGTRVAVLGVIIVFIYTIDIIIFLQIKNKDLQYKFKKLLIVLAILLLYIAILPFNPMFNRVYEMNNLQEYVVTDVESNNSGNVNLANEQSNINVVLDNKETTNDEENKKINYIKENYKFKNIHEEFIENRYPYKYDPDFWIGILNEDISQRTDYRHVELQMVKRVVKFNNNKLDIFLGISNTRVQNIFNIEKDFVVQYYALGLTGLILVFIPYMALLIIYIKNVFKSKLKYCTVNNLISFITIIMLFAISYNSGNLLNSVSFTIYFSFIFYNLLKNENSKEEKIGEKREDKMFFKNINSVIKKYKFLLYQLISRDFKVKYKRSILGVVWSLLYPVLTMSVMALVFSNIFKFSTPGVNYLVYLLTGLVMFNYFSEASNLSMSSVVSNFSLINKIYIPKYIFPLSKCLFVGINFLLTLIPLYAIIFITGTPLNFYHLLLPYAFICLFMFTLGVGLLLSAVSVFLRDMFYIYGIIMTLWMYVTPIMYDISLISEKFQAFFKLNPLYHYINFARRIILYNEMPSAFTWGMCAITSIATLILGIVVFRKNQDKFIYYV